MPHSLLPPTNKPPKQDRPLLHGLERAACEINPFLIILAVGIAVLDFTCYAGLAGSQRVLHHQPLANHAAVGAQPSSGG